MKFARISANVCYAQVCLEEVCTQLNLSGESTMGRLADGRFEKVLSMLIHVWLQESWALDIRYALEAVSYTHLRAHETRHDLVCRLLLEKKK